MQLLDLTLESPEENLACDEALLDECEEGGNAEILRLWEPRTFFVVVGSSNRVHTEVNAERCRVDNVPILRRRSGGGTVLQGPGCLNFCLIFRIPEHGPLSTISGTNEFILTTHKHALEPLVGRRVEVSGLSDLAVNDMKCSGNAQRRRLRCMMFHGTFLLSLDAEPMEHYLRMPSKQPSYRNSRTHQAFIGNLHLPVALVKEALQSVWGAYEEPQQIPSARIDRLVQERYGREEWNFRL